MWLLKPMWWNKRTTGRFYWDIWRRIRGRSRDSRLLPWTRQQRRLLVTVQRGSQRKRNNRGRGCVVWCMRSSTISPKLLYPSLQVDSGTKWDWCICCNSGRSSDCCEGNGHVRRAWRYPKWVKCNMGNAVVDEDGKKGELWFMSTKIDKTYFTD